MGVGERFVKDDLWIILHENQFGEMIFVGWFILNVRMICIRVTQLLTQPMANLQTFGG